MGKLKPMDAMSVREKEKYIARMEKSFKALKPQVQKEIRLCLMSNPMLGQRFANLL